MKPPVHTHTIFRAEVWNPALHIFESNDWMERLVKKIGMILEAGPITAYNPDVGYRGITTTCLIRTSHIAMHIWDELEPAMVQLDIYSCQDFLVDDVKDMLEEWNLHKLEYMTFDREDGFKLLVHEK